MIDDLGDGQALLVRVHGGGSIGIHSVGSTTNLLALWLAGNYEAFR